MRSVRHPGLLAVAMTTAVVALAGLLAGCAPTTRSIPAPSSPDPRLAGAWHLRAGADARGTLPLDDSDITLTIGNSTDSGGRSVCTRYSARITGGIGAVFVSTSPMLSDRCQTITAAVVDSRYLDELGATRIAAVADGVLTLSSAHGSLQFTKVGSTASLTGFTWVLDSLSDATSQWLASSVQGSATLRFSPDGVFVISTTCATLTAKYRIVGQQVTVGSYSEDVGNGGICNDKTGAVGAVVMSMVGGAFSYELKNGALEMTANGLGTSATFIQRG